MIYHIFIYLFIQRILESHKNSINLKTSLFYNINIYQYIIYNNSRRKCGKQKTFCNIKRDRRTGKYSINYYKMI